MNDRPALQELLRRNAALPQPPGNAYPAEMIDKVEDTIREEIVKNAITQAHGDTCRALDRIVEEATALLDRIRKRVDLHKQKLENEGQKIAQELEASLQILTATVEWVEKQQPQLRHPQLRITNKPEPSEQQE
jgi:uncharacterized protein YicC (UPF0701 family)